MSDSDPIELFRSEQLGPAHASVTLERRQWMPSGDYRYVLTETWQIPDPEPGQPDRYKQLSVTNVVDDGDQAMRTARELADTWARSSDRADHLSPGGDLPELSPSKRARAGGIPGLNKGASLAELQQLLRSIVRARG